MRSKLIGLLVASVLSVTLAAPALAIVYGEPDTNNEYSNVGALIAQFDDGKFVICTGTLISPTVFLTAAHCVDDGGTYWVSFEPFIEEPVTNRSTLYEGTAYAHPDFASGGANDTFDIAVIVFDKPVRGIQPAELPTLNMLDEMTAQELKSATFVAVGYGTVRDTRQGAHQSLYWDPHRRFAAQSVNSLEPAWLSLSMNQATGDGGTCYGDSGGPHFLGDVVVSITVTGDVWCKATDKTYRIDTQVARDFLDDFVTLP